jgi:hypothetical protein
MALPPLSLDSMWHSTSGLAAQLERTAVSLPYAAAVALTLVGLIVAVLGSRPPTVRVVAFVVGAALGLQLAPVCAPYLHFSTEVVGYLLAAALAILGAAVPESVVFIVFGGLAGLVGAAFFAPADRLFGFVPGFLVGGVTGAIFFPWIAAGLTGLGGGVAFAVGLARALPPKAGGAWLLGHPLAILGLALALGISGFLGQLRQPTEVDDAAEDAEQSRKDQIKKSDRARDARFENYAKKSRKQRD